MIGIVGGGIAGLASAYRLQQQGFDVHVFEASESIGGLAAVYETAGDNIEKFYHHLSKTEETIVELAEELGIGDKIEWKIGTNGYYVDGVIHPLNTPWEILAYPHLNMHDTIRLGGLTAGVDLRGGYPTLDSYEDLTEYEHETVESFVREHTTDNVYENFVDPLLDGKYGARKKDISAAWFLGRIRFRGERDLLRGEVLGYPRGGFTTIIDGLIDAVGHENISINTPVTGLKCRDDTVESIIAHDQSTQTEYNYSVDGVVVATMPNVLEQLTGYTCQVEFQGAVCGLMHLEESLMDTYWLNIAHDAPFGALIEHTNFIDRDRYDGEHLVYVAAYVQDPSEPLWQANNEAVRRKWLNEIESMFPDFDRENITELNIARNPRAAPIYECGYLDLVIPYDLSERIAHGIYYAGMASEAQYPERSLNGGVVAGFNAADRIVSDFEADSGTHTSTLTTEL
jgi:protoporphyrinogen oxidase